MTARETPTAATISIQEAAQLLGISKGHAYRLAAENCFPTPVIKLGDRVLVCREPFERLLREGSAPQTNGEAA